jgi:glycosyltransferase involved in cell wall biosynthesis
VRVLWVHSGSWKSSAAISYIGVHNAWSFARAGVETHLLMPEIGVPSNTDDDLRDFYGLDPHSLLHIHRITLQRRWWNFQHPYFLLAESMANEFRRSEPLLVLTREQRFLPQLARIATKPNCHCLFEAHYLYADQSWRNSANISRGDKKRGALERKYLRQIDGIVAITADQLKLYQEALLGLKGIAAPLGVKSLPMPDDAEIETRRGRRVVAYIGHLMRSKGIPGMLSVAGALSKENIRIAMFGGTPEEAENIRGTAEAKDNNISITPFLSPAKMFQVLAETASIGIVALEDDFFNRHLTCPVKALDFLALGMPVVASDLTSTRDVLGNAALYFPPGDANQMSEQIRKLLSDADLYLSVSKLAIARAAELSWESRAKLLIRPFAARNFANGAGI